VIAGVCGGLGRHLGVDPVVFRVLFVVFAIFGGIGALVYGAMWLIAPADGQDRSAAQRLAGGTFDLDSVIAVAVGLFGLLAFSRFLLAGFGAEVPFLLLAAFCAALVLANNRSALSRFTNRDQRGGWGNPPPWQGPPPGWGGPPPGAGPGGWGTPPHDADQSQSQSAPDQTTSTATMGGGGRPPTGWPPAPPGGSTMTGPGPTARAPGPPPWWQQPRPVATSPTWPSASGVSGGPAAVGGFGAPGDGGASPPAGGGPGGPYGAPPASGRPYQPPARQQRSGFGCLIVFLGIVLAGALLSLDAANTVHLGLRTVLAIVLVILGVGLAMGAWYGRARVVILLASIVTVALVVVASPGMPAYGGVGGRDWHPTAATSGTLSYQLSAGDGRLDLTALDSGNGWVPVNASVGFGRLLVWVPDSMTVVVTEHAGAGTLIVGDGPFETGNRGGLGVNRSYRFEPTAGQPSRGTIQLSAKVGIGVVEVRRVAA
jgi:phage shock protein PspC (stress-responsive transcriptional regulator)